MIGFLRGKVQEKTPYGIILDVNGVGYELYLSAKSITEVPPVGGETSLHTYLYVREDTLQLFGFTAFAEKDIFNQLLSIQGVGPRVALSILSALTVTALKKAILTEDVDLITSVPGIGKKSAQRLILELKEKISLPHLKAGSTGEAGSVFVETRNALVSLGYTIAEANKALEGFVSSNEEITVEELIKYALKKSSQ
ncbi:MAG: Holliday junction branch migration protein RuvA [Candidatus Subteraquimicrobiales bacterium]|nr:Holliday junction branch migration protein RuvA [Candidatus Subteraquimicrobiales bacterium]